MDFRKDNFMESVEMKSEIETQKIERIILDSATVSVVKVISDQINLELGDLVQVTQKSVANFLIRKRFQPLSAQEMSEFLSENYDLVKALKHATQEAIKAKQNGNNIEINDVLKLIQTPSVKAEMPLKKTRGRKKKLATQVETTDKNKPAESLSEAVNSLVNSNSNSSNSTLILDKNRAISSSESA